MPYLIAAALGFTAAYIVVAVAILPGDDGTPDVTVPSVVGSTVDDAARRLERVGLRGRETSSRPSAGSPAGTIVEQSPIGGSIVRPGSVISFVTSAGQRAEPVPNVAGMSRRDAERAIEDAGFAIGPISQRTSDSPRGTVLATSPAGGTDAVQPGPVELIVSGGPSAVRLPNVVGRTYAEARQTLEQLGLVVQGAGLDSTSTAAAGTVVSMSPTAGRSVPSGSEVALRLSAGIGLISPP
jgi:serine/threonine-protein kinase